MTVAAAITQLVNIKAFFLAGHAKFTLVSKLTGERKTFLVEKTRTADGTYGGRVGYFVRQLVGPENTSDFRYLCYVYENASTKMLCAKQNRDKWGTESFAAVVWLLGWFNGIGRIGTNETKFFDQCEFWHAGSCARCGRDLTDPESIARGLGPKCAGRE